VSPVWDRSKALAELKVREVDFQIPKWNAQGYSFTSDGGHRFAINPVAVYPFKTLLHELGHIVLGHTVEVATEETHRGVREFQAEAVAHILMHEFDAVDQFDPAESRAYIQNWLSGAEPPTKKEITPIFRAAEKIRQAGYPVKKEDSTVSES
jgi:hypothetical protein